MEFKVLYKVNLDPVKHSITGNTKHYHIGELITELPNYLQIESNPNVENEVYLIHYRVDESEVCDTLHDSVGEAMRQAEFEYGVNVNEWIIEKD